MMKCINCGYEEEEHTTPKKGGACFVYQPSRGENWFWLSFADPDLPEGTQFLGAAIVYGQYLSEAITLSHILGINPGGEVMSQPIPNDKLDMFPENMRQRLLTREEAESL